MQNMQSDGGALSHGVWGMMHMTSIKQKLCKRVGGFWNAYSGGETSRCNMEIITVARAQMPM